MGIGQRAMGQGEGRPQNEGNGLKCVPVTSDRKTGSVCRHPGEGGIDPSIGLPQLLAPIDHRGLTLLTTCCRQTDELKMDFKLPAKSRVEDDRIRAYDSWRKHLEDEASLNPSPIICIILPFPHPSQGPQER